MTLAAIRRGSRLQPRDGQLAYVVGARHVCLRLAISEPLKGFLPLVWPRAHCASHRVAMSPILLIFAHFALHFWPAARHLSSSTCRVAAKRRLRAASLNIQICVLP